MELSSSFSMPPGENPHRYFKNLCIEFKKLLKSTKDTNKLQEEMQKLLNVDKEMLCNEKTLEIYKKNEKEKIITRIWKEFKRYIECLDKKENQTNIQELLDSIEELELLIEKAEIK